MDFKRLTLALLVTGSVSVGSCGADRAEPIASMPQSTSDDSSIVSCPDPVRAADAISLMLPTYDYQGTATPGQLAGHSDLVVVGEVVEAGTTADELWLGLRDANWVRGNSMPGPDLRIIVDNMTTGELETGPLEGLQVMAFLYGNEPDVMHVALEGLWLACDLECGASSRSACSFQDSSSGHLAF